MVVAKILHVFILFLLFTLPFTNTAILINQPSVGQTLYILSEGSGNSTASIRMPDGQRREIVLENGQASLNASVSGRWIVSIKNESTSLIVRIEQGQKDGASNSTKNQQPIFFLSWLLFLGMFIFLIALVAFAMYLLVFEPKIRGALLSKKTRGGEVEVILRAGDCPLFDVSMTDSVGPQWQDSPLKLSAKRLDEGKEMALRYSYSGQIGKVSASFKQNGQECFLSCIEGITYSSHAEQSASALLFKEKKKESRKMEKFKD